MSSFDFPTLVARALRFSLSSARLLGLACFIAMLANSVLLGESLEKSPVYFYERYGSHKTNKSIVGYEIYTPFKHIRAPIEEPCLIRNYNKGGVSVDVLFSDPKLEALWVRITLKEQFTDQILAAALSVYGSGWKRLTSDVGLGVEVPLMPVKRLYQSEEGRIAYFLPAVKQLMIYSTDSIEAAKRFEALREREKAKVPVF